MHRRTLLCCAMLILVLLGSSSCDFDDTPALVPPTVSPATPEASTAPAAPTSPSPPTLAPSVITPTIIAAPPLRLRQIATIGIGEAIAAAIAPGGKSLAVGTLVGWGLYSLPDLQQVRFDVMAGGASNLIWADNGRYLAVGSPAGGKVYRFPDGTLTASLPTSAGSPVAFSSDGRALLFLHGPMGPAREWVGRTEPSYATLLESDTGAILASLETLGSVIFSPDTTLLTTEGEDETLFWEAARLPSHSARMPLVRVPGIRPRFSPNGRLLATISDTGTRTKLWRVPSGELIADIPSGEPTSTRPVIAFSDDNRLISIVADQLLQIWDVAQQKLIASFPVPEQYVQFSSDGRMLVNSSEDSAGKSIIHFVRVSDGQVLYTERQARSRIGEVDAPKVTLSADSATAAYLMPGGHIRVLDLAGSSTRDLMLSSYSEPSFSFDGQSLAAIQSQEAVAVWRLDDLASVQQFISPEPLPPNSWRYFTDVDFTPNGKTLVAVQHDATKEQTRSVTIRWELAGDASDQTVPVLHRVEENYLYSTPAHAAVWVDQDGIQLLPDGGSPITLAPANDRQVTNIAFSSDGRLLAVSDNGGFLRVFRIAPTIGLIQTIKVGTEYGADRVVFSHDGMLLGIRANRGLVWRRSESWPPTRFSSGSMVQSVLSPKNQLIIAIRLVDEQVAFYRRSDGQEVGEIPIFTQEISVSPTGDRLALIVDGQIQIWEIGA